VIERQRLGLPVGNREVRLKHSEVGRVSTARDLAAQTAVAESLRRVRMANGRKIWLTTYSHGGFIGVEVGA
jgi:hypothetical protein